MTTPDPISGLPTPAGWYRLARQVGGTHHLAAVRYDRTADGPLTRLAETSSPCGRIKVGAFVHFQATEAPPDACPTCRQAGL